jgi:CzcA family heavy metal efflux pump
MSTRRAAEPTAAPAGLFAWLLRNRAVVLTASAALLVAGGLALPRLPSGIYPEVEFPRISVVVRSGDDPPEVLQAAAVRPVEEALATVLNVRRVRSRIVRGAAEVGLLFTPGTDMVQALQFVNARLAEVQPELPAGTELEAERLTPAEFPILAFNLVGGPDGAARRETAERVVRAAFARAPGVARIDVLGGDEREIEVIAEPARLAALRLRPHELLDQLSERLVRRAVGRYDAHHQTSAVVVESPERTAEDIGHVAIAVGGEHAQPVALSGVADVRPGAADRRILVRAPEGDAVQISVSRLPGASTPDVVAAVLGEARAVQLPAGMRMIKVYDQGELVSAAIDGIRDAILIGIALTLLVLALFLRDVRTGLLAALSLPATLLVTFAAMRLAGQSLNLMSLGGLAIAIGLVIDDAVVVVEAMVARRERGEPIAAAIGGALDDVASPVLGTTLTTVVVFTPLAFLEGIVGRFFASLAATLSAAVLLSLLFALVVLPVLARPFLVHAGVRRHGRRRGLRTRYAAALRSGLRHRKVMLAAGAVLLVAGLIALRFVPTGFLPEFDEGTFVLDYFLPAGTSLAETDRAVREIEARLTANPAVSTWSRRTGAELGPITATEFSHGDITVRLKPRSERPDAEDVIDDVRRELAASVPSARVEFVQLIEDVLSDLSGAPRPIELRVLGDTPAELERAARDVRAAIEDTPGLVDYYTGLEGRVPVLRVRPDAAQLARLGRTPAELADDLEVGLRGKAAATVPFLDRLIDVRLRFPDSVRYDAAAIARLPIVASSGFSTPLSDVAGVREEPEPSVLFRENLRPVVLPSGDIEGSDLGTVGREIARRLKSVRPPAGGLIAVGGRIESQNETFQQLAGVFALGLLAVLAVMVAQFRAVAPALLVLATIPTALAGAFLLLAATRVPLNASSLIGVVLLTGLVVKNGILLLERAQRRRAAGQPARVAVLGAARERLRPIVMTTLCTVFGLLPLALGIGAAGEMQRPLALAVVGGLFVSTAATLFVLPALAARRGR